MRSSFGVGRCTNKVTEGIDKRDSGCSEFTSHIVPGRLALRTSVLKPLDPEGHTAGLELWGTEHLVIIHYEGLESAV